MREPNRPDGGILRGRLEAFGRACLLAGVLIAASAPAPAAAQAEEGHLARKAQLLVKYLKTESFQSVFEMFDPGMQRDMPVARLEEYWKTLTARHGGIEEIGGTRVETAEGRPMVVISTRFERGDIRVIVAFNGRDEVIRLFFTPASRGEPLYSAPPYADSSIIEERGFVLKSGSFELPGTLTYPKSKGPFACAILLAGRGANDRDGTVGPNKPLRDLAWGLATRNIASLRYEKRTRAFGSQLDVSRLTYREEVVDDAAAAVREMLQTDRIDPSCVFLVGHGLGGQLSPEVVEQCRSGFRRTNQVAGVVVMGASARPIKDVITDQLNHMAMEDGESSPEERQTIIRFVNGIEEMAASRDENHPPVMGITWNYLQAINSYDALKTARKNGVPYFIAQGGRDFQAVPSLDYAAWKEALEGRDGVYFKLYPRLNHLFMEGEGTSYAKEYEIPGHVSEEFINDLAAWIQQVCIQRR